MTPPDPAKPKRAAIVYNPIKVDLERLRAAVALAESEHGWAKSMWLETTEDEPGHGLARRAAAERVDMVIAAGGDGTVRSVGAGLRGTGISLGLLPSGTGNLLARNLGLDVNSGHLEASVDTAFGGYDHAIDMGVVEIDREDGTSEEHAFLVMAGLGLDAKMIAKTDPELKKKVGWLAYAGAIGQVLVDKEVLRIRYRLDGGEERASRVHTILVGNCGSLPGNILLLPDAEVDDGLFDIVTLRPEGFGGWARIWVGIVWENGVLRRSSMGRKLLNLRQRPVRALRYLRGRRLHVDLDRPEEFELDGDEFGMIIGFRAEVDPASLLVRMPQASAD
ncbi:diacylglycerol/lipid kinase family protein [Protaetiibacter mangrovi]|uniref:Diacylglycerol kinase n=1 Tax=Protaetiibacter mangrovi TaxID=2970926 RepID=A0ABT1ZGV5_9MICO|nr:diacylglycerol kinase family protein [Protaetiibacter mangrovi]MCS0499946.1 diacylglycerol kinase [Protaetiibacter mangrovi]TPX02802.1 diacylglycerol kinase [Schumannella luteola]